AAGAWSRDLLRSAGLDLPLSGALTQWIGFSTEANPPAMMTVGDGVSGSYFRPDREQILVGLGSGSRQPLRDLDAEEPDISSDIVQLARERLAARLAGATEARHTGGRTGPISLTPDDLPIIDRHPQMRGLYYFA